MQGARHKSVQIGVTQSEYECAGIPSQDLCSSGSRHDLLGTTQSKERLADVFESVRPRRKTVCAAANMISLVCPDDCGHSVLTDTRVSNHYDPIWLCTRAMCGALFTGCALLPNRSGLLQAQICVFNENSCGPSPDKPARRIHGLRILELPRDYHI